MKKSIFAAFILAGFAASAAAQVSFDQGVDVTAAISMAAASDIQVPLAAPAARLNYSRDCVRFTFGPSDEEMVSRKVYLRTTESETVCTTVMVPGPNGTQVPQQNCYERPGMTWYRYAQIKLNPRKLFPWERDSFDVCLQGPWMDIYANATAYRYTAKREGYDDVLFTLTPHEKTAMRPDEDGVSYADFAYADGRFSFKASDKWAREYSGEKVAITVKLYKDNALFFDTFKGEKEFTFDAAESYAMAFSEDELSKPEAGQDDDSRGAKKYYLKWSFKRIGSISTDREIKKDKTPVITK